MKLSRHNKEMDYETRKRLYYWCSKCQTRHRRDRGKLGINHQIYEKSNPSQFKKECGVE